MDCSSHLFSYLEDFVKMGRLTNLMQGVCDSVAEVPKVFIEIFPDGKCVRCDKGIE